MKSFEKDDLDQPAPGKGYLGDILQWWSKRFPGPLRSTAPSLAPFSDHQPTAHRHLDHELWKSFLKLIILLEQCWFWEKLWFVTGFQMMWLSKLKMVSIKRENNLIWKLDSFLVASLLYGRYWVGITNTVQLSNIEYWAHHWHSGAH